MSTPDAQLVGATLDELLDRLATALLQGSGDDRLRPIVEAIARQKGERWSSAACAKLATALAAGGADTSQSPLPEDDLIDMATTGGAGLKTSIVVSTWLAFMGFRVPKIASGGGSRAGTIDTLRAMGIETGLTWPAFSSLVATKGLAFADQSDFAPADRRLMQIRHEQKAKEVVPLVISSILAKKFAIGLRRVVVEVRAGDDANTGSYAESVAAARRFVEVGSQMGMEVLAVVTNSDLLANHGFGPALLASECLRHLAWAFDDGTRSGGLPGAGFPDECGLIWDRSHRQALELLALCQWWAKGDRNVPPDRKMLGERVRTLGDELFDRRQEVLAFFLDVASAQGSNLSWDGSDVRSLERELLGRIPGIGNAPLRVKAVPPILVPTLKGPLLNARVWKEGGVLAARITGGAWQAALEIYPAEGTDQEAIAVRAREALAGIEKLGEKPLRPWEASELPPAVVLGAWYQGPDGKAARLPLRETVLVAAVGATVQVVTETLDCYFNPVAGEGLAFDRVGIAHTQDSGVLGSIEKLRLDLRPRPGSEIKDYTAVLGPQAFPVHRRVPLTVHATSQADVKSLEDNKEYLQILGSMLDREVESAGLWEQDPALYVSIAGGRKTMGALTYFASMLFPVTEVTHILVPPDKQKLFHVPPEDGSLVKLPNLLLGELVGYVERRTGESSQGRFWRDGMGAWSELRGKVQDFIRDSVARDEAVQERRTHALVDLGTEALNWLLGPVGIAVVAKEADTWLEALVRRELADLGIDDRIVRFDSTSELSPALDVAQFAGDERFKARRLQDFDAIVVAGAVLENPDFVGWLSVSPVPVLAIGTGSEQTRQLGKRFEHRFPSFSFLEVADHVEFACELHKAVAGALCDAAPPIEIDAPDLGEQEQLLLGRLFWAHAWRGVNVAGAAGGVSAAKKFWAVERGKPKQYFVKIAPYQACFSEFLNYQEHVRGVAENSSGRIDWRPARNHAVGALAYTEVGGSKPNETLLHVLTNFPAAVHPRFKEVVLSSIDKLHRSAAEIRALDATLIHALCNRLLPARGVFKACKDGPEVVEGRLYDVAPGLQILDRQGFKINIEADPMDTPRLYRGRYLRIEGAWKETFEQTYRHHLARKIPEDSHTIARSEVLNAVLATMAAPERFWHPLGRSVHVGTIHGDFNPENIVIEQGDSSRIDKAWLVDFAHTGTGLVLYDYAKLEIELWTQWLGTVLDGEIDFDGARRCVEAFYPGGSTPARELVKGSLPDALMQKEVFRESLHAARELLVAIAEQACRFGGDVVDIYDRLRGVYALNTLKFGNLKPTGLEFGLLLAARFLVPRSPVMTATVAPGGAHVGSPGTRQHAGP